MKCMKTGFMILSILFVTTVASGQATRTWVSGVGDDANPCSRTAPCKTFAGAISKTAAGGEIDALDPGGYGAVTITKSITIDGRGTHASILNSGVIGINVTDAATGSPNSIHVELRNLVIQGADTGIHGISMTSAQSLIIDHCVIQNQSNRGINVTTNGTNNRFVVRDTLIERIGDNGIAVVPAGGNLLVELNGVRVAQSNANSGVYFDNNVNATINNSSLSQNSVGAGLSIGASTVTTVLHNTTLSSNAYGIYNGNSGGGPTTRLSNCVITGNNFGVVINGGSVTGNGTNFVGGNAAYNTVSTVAAQ